MEAWKLGSMETGKQGNRKIEKTEKKQENRKTEKHGNRKQENRDQTRLKT